MPLAKAALPGKGLLRGAGELVAGWSQAEPFEPPKTRLEQGRAPAPPRAVSGAV